MSENALTSEDSTKILASGKDSIKDKHDLGVNTTLLSGGDFLSLIIANVIFMKFRIDTKIKGFETVHKFFCNFTDHLLDTIT